MDFPKRTIRRSIVRRSPIFLLPMFVLASIGLGGTGGSIAGTVVDQSGAVILARHTETGVRQETATNAEGFFAFPAMPGGSYELQVEHNEFRDYRQTGLVVTADAALQVVIELTLGPQTEAVPWAPKSSARRL